MLLDENKSTCSWLCVWEVSIRLKPQLWIWRWRDVSLLRKRKTEVITQLHILIHALPGTESALTTKEGSRYSSLSQTAKDCLFLFSPIFQPTSKCLKVKRDLQTGPCLLACLTLLSLTSPICWKSIRQKRRRQKWRRKPHCLPKKWLKWRSKPANPNDAGSQSARYVPEARRLILPLWAI